MKLSKKYLLWTGLLCAGFFLAAPSSYAGDEANVITMKDHQFSPAELVIPAGQKVKLVVKNLDSSPIEFESYELNREKIVAPNGQVVVFIGPLKPGTYPYFDDFHPKIKGVIKVK
ncbi:MAG: cupredoxin domain-containing protein [Alphaproteobacteria bacterium]|nr:cupredoxin domain-containing protein [Alphaproteobacteria bacterium]